MSPDQSDLGPYCLQYVLFKNISRRGVQMTKVVTSELRVNLSFEYQNHMGCDARKHIFGYL